MTWRLAWRGVWRNPRRTGLTLAAVAFAVFLVVFLVAMADGVHSRMIEDGVRMASGHLQVARAGYLDNRTLEYSLQPDAELEATLRGAPGVQGVARRVFGAALLSAGDSTRGAMLLGVDPRHEASVSSLPERLSQGAFLPDHVARPVVLGRTLAQALDVSPGDQVLLYSNTYTLENAYELFEVSGLVRLPDPTLERSMALVRLSDAQRFFLLGERISEFALLADNAPAVHGLQRYLESALAGRLAAAPRPVAAAGTGAGINATAAAGTGAGIYAAAAGTETVLAATAGTGSGVVLAAIPAGAAVATAHETIELNPWNRIMPELEQFIWLDDASMYIMLLILVVVVGFGILNTILMSVLERQRELGVLLALGLPPGAIFRTIYAESLILAGLGLGIGLLLVLPAVYWLAENPIPLSGEDMEMMMEMVGIEPVLDFELRRRTLPGAGLLIFGVAALASLYPAVKASRARPVDALRSI